MKSSAAFVPGHISGFFQIFDEEEEILAKGSRNCGICVESGALTTVEVEDSSSLEVEVSFENNDATGQTTKTVIRNILENFSDFSIEVKHLLQAPLGAGYGMSGAGALGAALALSDVLELGLGRQEILAEAHKSEVLCSSGLGDVGPQMLGGLVIGLRPGGPPYGKWEKISLDSEWDIVCATSDFLSTSDVLEDPRFNKRIKEVGARSMGDFLSEKTIQNFMKVSKKFSYDISIFDDDFLETLELISSESPIGASVAMLGRTVFAPAKSEEVSNLRSVFLDYFEGDEVMVTSIDLDGARILNA